MKTLAPRSQHAASSPRPPVWTERGAATPAPGATAAPRGRRRLGRRTRVTLAFGITSALVAASVAGIAYTIAEHHLTAQRERAIRDRAYVNARLLRDQLRAVGADPGDAVANLVVDDAAAALVRTADRWYSSTVSVESDEIPRQVVERGRDVAAWQRTTLRGVPTFVIAIPVPSVDAQYVEVVPLTELDRTIRTLGAALGVAVGLTVVTGSAIGIVVSGRIVKPVRSLAAALATGNRRALRSDGGGDPELTPLIDALNGLLDGAEQRAERDMRFVSDVSHEIRAPLAAFTAAVDVMQRRRAQLPERTAHALDLLAEQVDEFQQLVLDLLEISRIDAGRAELRPEPVEPRALVQAAARSIGVHDLECVVAANAPQYVDLDKRRIGQALCNLLENARRYAGGASSVCIEADEDSIRFVVTDNGPGIPERDRLRVFERFERGAADREMPSGTGLGLALVAEHARLHGGRAYVEGGSDGGARFVLEVPMCAP
jgi:signal transduction histidine kinase